MFNQTKLYKFEFGSLAFGFLNAQHVFLKPCCVLNFIDHYWGINRYKNNYSSLLAVLRKVGLSRDTYFLFFEASLLRVLFYPPVMAQLPIKQ